MIKNKNKNKYKTKKGRREDLLVTDALGLTTKTAALKVVVKAHYLIVTLPPLSFPTPTRTINETPNGLHLCPSTCRIILVVTVQS